MHIHEHCNKSEKLVERTKITGSPQQESSRQTDRHTEREGGMEGGSD